MKKQLTRAVLSGAAALCIAALLSPATAQAAKVMEIEAEQMVRAANYVKDTLNLTPNQQTLWQQVSSRSGAILRARQSRRERLQADLKSRLENPAQELRELAKSIELEAAVSAGENHELRELWLGVHDALNDQQRAVAMQFMVTQLERVDRPEQGTPRGEREGPPGGMRRQRGEGGGPPRM